MTRPTVLLLISLLSAPGLAQAQLRVSGQADLLARSRSDTRGLNRNFRSDSPFNELRVKVFGQHWLNDRVGMFTEFLFDSEADVRVNGAYVVITELGGHEWLDFRAGLAPSLVGTFGLRSTYFNSNPVVGVPLVWQHRTTLDGSGLLTNEDLVRRKASDTIGLPMIYEACWNIQWELMGHQGIFEYSLGVSPGSLSNPNGARHNEGVQLLGRLGMEPAMGFRLGVSGAVGPYIGGSSHDPLVEATTFPGSTADYDQVLYGFDLEVARGKAQLVSEAFVSSWDAEMPAQM